MHEGEWTPTDNSGTPQGGIISPTLANFTLNGIEPEIERAVKEQYNVKMRGIYIGVSKNSRGTINPRYLSTNLATIRYADDFVVLARSKRMIEKTVRPCVDRFLQERGLWLSDEKTRVHSIKEGDKINFLGYTIQHLGKVSPKYKLFHDRQNKEAIACYPQKEKYQAIVNKLKTIFGEGSNLTSYALIAKINPILRG